MQALCGLQGVFDLFNCKTPGYGVTYKEDKPVVVNAIQRLKDSGLYPQKLWQENKEK